MSNTYLKRICYLAIVSVLGVCNVATALENDLEAEAERYEDRYKGIRWSVVYGCYEGVERFALQELYKAIQNFQPYVIEVLPASNKIPRQEDHLILIGTPDNNPLIGELVQKKRIEFHRRPQGYSITCMNSPWRDGRRVLVIAGSDPRGVLYGVEDFNARILAAKILQKKQANSNLRQVFDSMGDFTISEYPLIENRGIWTWGYVIYDYRRFIDNMARLKMNMLTIWNDYPPLNCGDIIDYAHSRGVKIVLGFHWGWGTSLDLSKPEHRKAVKRIVLKKYDKYYRGLGMDAIYFQTKTEHYNLEMQGRPMAQIACELVNDIASGLFKKEPKLQIQFGLHGSSIRQQYMDLKKLDPRITIFWEDAGVIPYCYSPVTKRNDKVNPKIKFFNSPELTLEYSKKLATFRPETKFAMVPKGWINLAWYKEFEHHGPFILGERSAEFITERLKKRQPIWDRANALWEKNYPFALNFYREMIKCRPDGISSVVGLIEDGMFEEYIQPSVALFAEMIWNPQRNEHEILQLAEIRSNKSH